MSTLPCCATWDADALIAENDTMRAVLDAYPVTEGHALIVPKRHADRLADLNLAELADLHDLVAALTRGADATIAVNDGPAAGRTVPHLHVHVIPRHAGDVADPRGGVRQLFGPPERDPWINREDT